MLSNMEMAKSFLFDEFGLQASDIKISVGSSNSNSPEQIAGQVLRVLKQLEEGDYEIIESFND